LSLKANRVGDAVAWGRRLAALAPGNAQAHHLYGVALQAEGDREGARREFEQTLRLEPNHYEARENLRTLDRITSPTPSVR